MILITITMNTILFLLLCLIYFPLFHMFSLNIIPPFHTNKNPPCVSVLTIGAILGTSVLSMLPDTIKAALNYLLPALFGALLVQFGMKMKKHSVIMVVFAIILYFMIGMGYFNWLPGASNWLGTLGCVFVSIAVGMATFKNTTKE